MYWKVITLPGPPVRDSLYIPNHYMYRFSYLYRLYFKSTEKLVNLGIGNRDSIIRTTNITRTPLT